ncbi:MAG TPA: hypothetical protein VGO62_13510 [Myxococcota bacterium]|jgi:tetratricopeptide (TPR) repeat protein
MVSTGQSAESLWARAHEHVRRGDFASAVRDLAACYQVLQAANDPRVYEVHRRWTEVHKMYLEDGQRQELPPAQKAPSLEAEAEAAANAGDLDRAIALYQKASAQNPSNELIAERLLELRHAKVRADDLVRGTAPPVAARPAPPVAARPSTTVAAEDDWSDVAVEDSSPTAVPAGGTAATAAGTAPTMAVDDAPVGMQSLDVSFSVGEAIDAVEADELPVASAQPSATSAAGDVAFLESLLARIADNRRAL